MATGIMPRRQWSAAYPYLEKAYSVSDGKPVNAKIMVRGEPGTLGPEVSHHPLIAQHS